MVIRFLTLKNLATAVAVGALASCYLHTNSYGQTVGDGQEVTPVGEAPPTDPGDPNPTEGPQVVPGGEEPEAPEPNEELVCGTLSGSQTVGCPKYRQVSCATNGGCRKADATGIESCFLRDGKEHLFERTVTKTGTVGRVPRQVTSGVSQVYSKSTQLCYQDFSCAAQCEKNERGKWNCVSGLIAKTHEVFKYTEKTTKACVNGALIDVPQNDAPNNTLPN